LCIDKGIEYLIKNWLAKKIIHEAVHSTSRRMDLRETDSIIEDKTDSPKANTGICE